MSCGRCDADGPHEWLVRIRDADHAARTSTTLCGGCRDELEAWLRGGGA